MFRGLIVCMIAVVSGFCGKLVAEEGWYPMTSLPPGNWQKDNSLEKYECFLEEYQFFSKAAVFVKVEDNSEISDYLAVGRFGTGSLLFKENKALLTALPEDPRKTPLGISGQEMIEKVNEKTGHRIFLKFFRYHDHYLALIYSTNAKKDAQAICAQADDYLSKCKCTGLMKRGHLDVEGKVIPGDFKQIFRGGIGIFVPDKWVHASSADERIEYVFGQKDNLKISLNMEPTYYLNLGGFRGVVKDWAPQLGMRVDREEVFLTKNAKGTAFRLNGLPPNEDRRAIIGLCTKDGRRILETISYKGEKDPLIDAVMGTLEFLDEGVE